MNRAFFFRKDKKGKLEIAMSGNLDDIFMAGKLETLKFIKEKINEKFNISKPGKLKNFLEVYYK